MKRSNGIFWGGLLLVLGTFWLLRNLGLLNIDWNEVTRFWPVLLILAGVSLLVAGRERSSAAGGVAGILIALAVLGGITNRTDRAFGRADRNNWNFGWDSDDDNNDDWNFGDRQERRERRDKERRERDEERRERKEERARARQRGYDYDNDDGSNNGDESSDSDSDEDSEKRDKLPVSNRHYQYEMDQNLREATLNFEGGAGEFKLKSNTNRLFEADARSSIGGFMTDIRNNRNANTAVINFKMQSGQVNLKSRNNANEVDFSLNTAPIWNIDLGLGAGKADFDLSDYKVKSLKISTGVADLRVKLGDKVTRSDVKIESGVASVTMEVPRSVGCEVRIDGMLNDKDMGDLQKISDGLYRSPGFDRADRKIMINYDAGLSKVNIRRY